MAKSKEFGRSLRGDKKKEFEQKLADDFIRKIREGEVNGWSKGWKMLGGDTMPHNHKGRPYSGINTVILWLSGMEYESNTWATYHGWKEESRKHAIKEGKFETKISRKGEPYKHTTEWYGVQKGEVGTTIVLYKPSGVRVGERKNRETGESEEYMYQSLLMRCFEVFNRDQTGLPRIPKEEIELTADEFAENELNLENCLNYYVDNPNRVAKAIGDIMPDGQKATEAQWVMRKGRIELKHGGDRAFYTSGRDRIALPLHEQFDDNASYLSVKGHEIVHSTGHPLRLNRALGNRFGSEDYAKEELIAEFGTAFLLGNFNIQGELRNVEYINNWATVLSKEPRFLTTAAQKAQKAVNYILEPWQQNVENIEISIEEAIRRVGDKTIMVDELGALRATELMEEEE